MSPTDASESMLESTIVRSLVDNAGSIEGDPKDYDKDHVADLIKLLDFLLATQPRAVGQLGLDGEGIRLQQFLSRLKGEIAKRGIVDVLRKGINHCPAGIIQAFKKWLSDTTSRLLIVRLLDDDKRLFQ